LKPDSDSEESTTECRPEVIGRLLMSRFTSIRPSTSNHQFCWFEFEVLKDRKCVNVYRLAAQNRRTQRIFMATTDDRFALYECITDEFYHGNRPHLPHPLAQFPSFRDRTSFLHGSTRVSLGYSNSSTVSNCWSVEASRECLLELPPLASLLIAAAGANATVDNPSPENAGHPSSQLARDEVSDLIDEGDASSSKSPSEENPLLFPRCQERYVPAPLLGNLIPSSLVSCYKFWCADALSYFGSSEGSRIAWMSAVALSTIANGSQPLADSTTDETVPEAIFTGYPDSAMLRKKNLDVDTVILVRVYRRYYDDAHPFGLPIRQADVEQDAAKAAKVLDGTARVDTEALVTRFSLNDFLAFKRDAHIVAMLETQGSPKSIAGDSYALSASQEAAKSAAIGRLARIPCQTLLNPLRTSSVTLRRVVDAICRVEPLSASLFWSQSLGLPLLGDYVELHQIECVRLGTSFEPRTVLLNGQSAPGQRWDLKNQYAPQCRLYCSDVPGSYVSDRRDSGMAKYLSALPNSLILENELH